MTRPPLHPSGSALAIALLLLTSRAASAAPMADWESRQDLVVEVPGLLKIALPAEALNAARAGMEDLRLLSPSGRETPYLIERPGSPQLRLSPARASEIFVEADRTRMVIHREPGKRLSGLRLETTSREFLKAVTVREGVEAEGGRVLALNQPVFRQPGGATRLFIPLPDTAASALTVLVDDQKSQPIPIDGVRLQEIAELLPADEPVSLVIRAQVESPGESRVVIDLEAANLTLASLFLETSEPLFTRSVALLTREVRGGEIHERVLRSGTVYRVAVEGAASAQQLELPLDVQVAAREVVLRIDNGDSQPLRLDKVRLTRRPVYLVFQAPEAGRYTLLSGNEPAVAPRYDVASLAPQLRDLELSGLRVGPVQPNPDFQPSALLPTVPFLAGALDVSDWAFRRRVFGAAGVGVQELELDPEVLARSSRSLADLRLMSDGRQVPFVLERTSLPRVLPLPIEAATDPKRPTFSRWVLQLPEQSLPITRLACEITTSLFERQLTLVEQVPDDRGRRVRQVLAAASWLRTPDRATGRFWMDLAQPPRTDTLILETDNGDNPAIDLAACQALYPATRVLFRLPPETPVDLYFGNPKVGAPSYDLGLLARQILASRRLPAELDVREQLTRAPWLEGGEPSGVGTFLFWMVLGLVVVGLVFVMIRLLPKAAPPDAP